MKIKFWHDLCKYKIAYGENDLITANEEKGDMMEHNTTGYLTLTEENFQELIRQSTKPVLVDFWAPWCEPCQTMNPIISELAAELEANITIGKVNVDQQPQLAAEYRIQSIPTFLLFRDGKVEDTVVGAVSKNVLVEKVQALSLAR